MTQRKLAIAATLLVMAICFVLAEVGLRLYQKAAKQVPFSSLIPEYRDNRFLLSPFLVFGPRIDWQIPNKKKPEHAYFNKQGFRTPDTIGAKEPGEYRVITLGGSTTEDVWNDEGIHWPLVLEQELRQNGMKRLRVLNAAMSAYTTAHSLVRLAFDVAEFEPDMVIVMHNINDLMVNYQAAASNLPVDPHYKVLYSTKRFTGDISNDDVILSRVAHAVSTRIRDWGQPRNGPVVENTDLSSGKRFFARNLSNLAALTRSRGIRLVLLTMPYSRARNAYDLARENGRPFPTHPQLLADLDTYNQTIRETGAKQGVPVIDMASLLGSDEKFFVDIVHYSTAGVTAFGKTLAPKILPLVRTNTPVTARVSGP